MNSRHSGARRIDPPRCEAFDAVTLSSASGRRLAGLFIGLGGVVALVGIDVAVSIGDAIDVQVPHRLRQMQTLGELGKKTGRGFYDYE